MSSLDIAALRQGGLVALVFAVPFSIAARLLADSEPPSPWRLPLFLLAFVGFVLGAGIAAWVQRRGLPLLHGLVCAGGAYLAAQAVFVIVKLIRGGHVNWLGVMFNFTVVLGAGLIGGGLGGALQKRGIAPRERGGS